jgi:AcrR family transcriptional regulator
MSAAEPLLDRKRLLIHTARKLFSQRPYEKVTTTEIARSAGVAYGLIAFHYENKRGLYLAVMNDIANELAAEQEAPVEGDTLALQLRNALTRHVHYIDANAAGFVAMMRGGLGADPDLRAMLDQLRWAGAARILRRIGVDGTPPATLRAAMRGWVAYFDELMLDRLENNDVELERVVELAAANLVTTLRVVTSLDPQVEFAPEIGELLHG